MLAIQSNAEGAAMEFEEGPSKPPAIWEAGWPQTREEFGALVEAFQGALVRYAFRRLGNIQDAEDVVQEVFVRAYTNRTRHKSVSHVAAYLYRMSANACTDLLRKRKRAHVWLGEIKNVEAPANRKDAPHIIAAAEGLRRAEALLSRLPSRQAEVIRLRVFDELRLSEIAEVVGCSVDTVSSRLRYGFEKLRKIISREWEVSK